MDTSSRSASRPGCCPVSPLPDKELDRLYGLPLDEFTRERNELAKRLRAEGESEASEAVRKLKKPSLPAWTVNQLVRRHRKEVRRLLDADERLREAHEGLLSGGERKALSDAAAKERELVGGLVEKAEPLLSEGGSPSPANLERVRNTLHAAALDEELRGELEAGRVVSDREPAGLGPFAAAEAGGRPTRQAREQRSELRQARRREEQAEKRLQSAERALERARVEAEEAHEARRRSEEEFEEAKAALEQARRG